MIEFYCWRTHTVRPLDTLTVEDIDLREIARVLSKLCRYAGRCSGHYSVAQHSVLVSKILELQGGSRGLQAAGLLHDAEEAWVGDIIRPVKQGILSSDLVAATGAVKALCREKYGTPDFLVVNEADELAFAFEVNSILFERPWFEVPKTYHGMHRKLLPFIERHMMPEEANRVFLERAKELGIDDDTMRRKAEERGGE